MNPKNNQTIAGIVFFILWIIFLVSFGNAKNIKADLSEEVRNESSRTFGHPLYQD